MMRGSILVFLSIVSSGSASRPHGSPKLIQTEPSPHSSKIVQTIFKVEQKWLDLAARTVDCGAANCTANATEAISEFNTSCSAVSHSILKGTAGDRSRLQGYMADVCSDASLQGEKAELCLDYAQTMAQNMGEDQHANQEGAVDLSKVCMFLFENGFLSQYTKKVADRIKQKQAERAEEEELKAEKAKQLKEQAKAEEKAAQARQRLEAAANHTKVVSEQREDAVRAAVDAQRKAQDVREEAVRASLNAQTKSKDVESAKMMEAKLEEQAQSAEKEARAAAEKATHAKAVRNATAQAKVATQNVTAPAQAKVATQNVTAFLTKK